MYLMQSVSTGPAARSFPGQKHFDDIIVMNDEEITKYSDGISHYRSPTLATLATGENDESYVEKCYPKKEKKWFLGGLFRRKKKDVNSESSSDDEVPQKRGFLQRRKHKKDDKRKRKANKTLATFDHVVLPSNVGTNGSRPVRDYCEDIEGILSDPNLRITDQDYPKVTSYHSNEYISIVRNSRDCLTQQNSLDSLGKRSRREKVKARVEALRDQMKNNSSSDEGSQQSNASSANNNSKFRSDESLTRSGRKSRSARTERYIKRLTKEEERVLNKEAEMEKHRTNSENKIVYNRWNVVDVPGTVPSAPASHRASSSDNQRNQNIYQNVPDHRADSRSRNHIYQNPRNEHLLDHRSFSYDCNIDRSVTPHEESEIRHVQYPLGKPVPKPRNPNTISHLSNQYSSSGSLPRSPPPPLPAPSSAPPPPPRDPQRKVFPTYQYEGNNRPISYAFENGNQGSRSSVAITEKVSVPRLNSYQYNQNISRSSSFGLQPNYRSNSEDHIGQAKYKNFQTRPASATPDMKQQRFSKRHPFATEQYQYFADKTPRSRKPIHIATSPVPNDQSHLSDDSKTLQKAGMPQSKSLNSASEFWRQKDLEEIRRKSQVLEGVENKKGAGRIIAYSKAEVLRSSSQADISCPSQVITNERDPPPLPPVRGSSRHSSGSSVDQNEIDDRKRRSTNLEEALDELEAIYKSLRLGDEDLLDRAERRDVSVAAQKLLSQEHFTKWNNPKEVLSDSGFNYDVDTVDGLLPKKREFKKFPNKLNDDMAYRRLYKDKNSRAESPVSQASYLLTSPLLGAIVDDASDQISLTMGEPDITLDDVVYRNLKHVNNTLRIGETQLPFGIPVGPITAASNSDYLHAVPESHHRSRFVPQKSPDIVKDDLAYRALRKDNSRDPSLPHMGPDDYVNNNTNNEPAGRKKRAIRSMSANIFNIMRRNYEDDENEFDKTQSLTDIADAMEIAHKILREHNSKIFSKMTFSDTEIKPRSKSNFNNNPPTSTETLTESKPNLSDHNLKVNNVQRKIRERFASANQDEEKEKEEEEISNNHKPPIYCLQQTPDRQRKSRSTTKESTPLRSSPGLDETSQLDKSQLEELLTALAIEARETSEKLGNDLRLLEEETRGATTPSFPTTEQTLTDIDAVSEHAKLCEKLLECVVESTELIAPKIPEHRMEQVNEFLEPCYKSVANIIVTRNADVPVACDPLYSESDHDYDNVANVRVGIKQEENVRGEEREEREEEVTEAGGGDDVKTLIDVTPRCVSVTSCCKSQEKEGMGELTNEYLNGLLLTSANVTLTKNDEHSSRFHTDSNGFSPDFSKFELCTHNPPHAGDTIRTGTSDNVEREEAIFHDGNSVVSRPFLGNSISVQDTVLEDDIKILDESVLPEEAIRITDKLNTPSTLFYFSDSSTEDDEPKGTSSNVVPITPKSDKMSHDASDDSDSNKKSAWYRNPTNLILACSYAVACAHQLAILDVVTLLGLILAIISVFAAFIL